jgi:ketosteroid isomerase-like protein
MSSASDEITALLTAYASTDREGTFFLTHTTDDFKFIRPSGNPVDATGYAGMFKSGDIVVSTSALTKIHKLDVYGDVAFVAFTQAASFTYKGAPNDDVCTVSALLKKTDDKWEIAWMQRSSGTTDLSTWA